MIPEQRCAQRVFSGARWDIGGHPCQRAGRYEEDGKWWCKQHRPSARQAKQEARDEEYSARLKADEERRERAHETARRLSAVLGVEVAAFVSAFHNSGYLFVITDPGAALARGGGG